jgi:hypothetical protein
LVFDDLGYLKLTDFGIAREWTPDIDNSNEKYFALMHEEKDLYIDFRDTGKKCIVELSSIEEDVDPIDELPITYTKGTIGKVMRTTRRIVQLKEVN